MKRRVERGKPLDELVKGALDYTMERIRTAFRTQFRNDYEAPGPYFYIEEIFGEHLIVRQSDTPPDEYFLVPYRRVGESYVFAARAEWETVELAYQAKAPSPAPAASTTDEGRRTEDGRSPTPNEFGPNGPGAAKSTSVDQQGATGDRSAGGGGKRLDEGAGRRRIVERTGAVASLLEAQEGQPRRIKAVGITAGVINGNGRRYPAEVLRAAVDEAKTHLHESLGQGRLLPLLGEVEHPSDKGGRPSLLETVVKWDAIDFDGTQVLLEGSVLQTAKGRDILALMEGGVMPPISQRGRGESKTVKAGGQRVEEVTDLQINGYDLVLEASDPAAGVVMLEARALQARAQGERTMELEELVKLIKEHPELFPTVKVEDIKGMAADAVKALEEQIRQALGIDEKTDLGEALKKAAQAQREIEESQRKAGVDAAIAEQTKELPYGELNEQFVAAVRAAAPGTAEAVKPLVEAKRGEYDAIMAKAKLLSMGFKGVKVLGPVLERETGMPEFARGSHEFTEALVRRQLAKRWDPRQPKTINEEFAAQVLARFDECYKVQMQREAKLLEETELASDLNLPYSVSRTIVASVWPQLVATSIFDMGLSDQAPTRLYYETYTEVAGKHAVITDEGVTASNPLGSWVQMAHKMLQPGSVVATDHAGSTTYVEGTDYVVDYINGKFMALTGGGIAAGGDVHVDYHYDAIREGENTAIQRGKLTLSYATLEFAADRLATQITNEAIVFSRSQIGWDATSRTLAGLISEIRRRIDQGLLYNGLSAALSVATNSGGTWTAASDPIATFVQYVGVARVKVAKRYYEPTFLLLSTTNSDAIANWDGFTAAGKRPDADINANGYLGRLKGLPVFDSTEFSDAYGLVGNREIVMHRVYQPMALKGPYPSYSNGNLVAADQWYAEEYNGTLMPVPSKGSVVKIA